MGFCAHRKFLTLVWYGNRLFSMGYDEKHLARLDTCFRRSQRGKPGVRGHRSRIEPRMLSARAARRRLRSRRSGASGPMARLFRVCQSTSYRRDHPAFALPTPGLRPKGYGAASRRNYRLAGVSGVASAKACGPSRKRMASRRRLSLGGARGTGRAASPEQRRKSLSRSTRKPEQRRDKHRFFSVGNSQESSAALRRRS